MIYNSFGECIQEITSAENINEYTPSTTFEGYLGVGIDKDKTVEGDYIMFSYNENASYEPFTPNMPTPPYPSKIHNAGENGSINIKVQNKNLYNISDIKDLIANGIEYTILNSNSIKVSGKSTGNSSFIQPSNSMKFIKTGRTYTISYDVKGTYSGMQFIVSTYDVNCENVIYNEISISPNPYTFTATRDGYLRVYLQILGVDITVDCIVSIQVEEGSIATDYAEHEEQTITFPLQQGQVIHKGDYLADDGIHHKRKTIELKGTETIIAIPTHSDDNFTQFNLHLGITNIDSSEDGSKIICSHFKYYKNAHLGNFTQEGIRIYSATSANFVLAISSLIANTEETIKAYLAEQYANGTPIEIEYELAEEEIEAYTEEQQQIYNKIQELHSYYGTTHITCEDETSCNFDIIYVQDINLVRQNDKQELQTQIDEMKQAIVALGGV